MQIHRCLTFLVSSIMQDAKRENIVGNALKNIRKVLLPAEDKGRGYTHRALVQLLPSLVDFHYGSGQATVLCKVSDSHPEIGRLHFNISTISPTQLGHFFI